MSKLPAWSEVEARFAESPRSGVAAVCQRAAMRLSPVIARAESVYGPETVEWLNAVSGVLRLLEPVCRGVALTRFTLDIAAEVARGTANSARILIREKGPSKAAEDAELAFAAAAFAVDVCRATTSARVASVGMQCLRIALDGGTVPEQLVAFDFELLRSLAASGHADWTATADGPFGDLWPFGEPDWVTAGVARLRELEQTMPKMLCLPGW